MSANKTVRISFHRLPCYLFRFGNHPANGLVTEQPQYSVVVCIFSTWQNTEISLIPNGLRFIFTCSLSLALPCIFHCARHTFGSLQVEAGTSIYVVQKMLAHKDVETTQIYANMADEQKRLSVNRITLKSTSITGTD